MDELKAAAAAAGLQGEQQKQVDDLVKALFVHRELSNMPPDLASKKAAQLTPGQRQDLVNKFGSEDPQTKPTRGWLNTAWHYLSMPVVEPVKLVFKGLTEISDAMTRTYRALAIPLSEGRIDFEWAKANDKGDKVYNNGRIDKAKAKYGEAAVEIAMRIKSKEDPPKIWATATDEQKKYLMLDDPNNKTIPGVTDVEGERALWNTVLAEVDRAKYSPGRQIANFLLPQQAEKNGLVYSITAGLPDLLYRVFADPTVIGTKVRSAYLVGKYSLEAVAGAGKVAETFAKPTVQKFWNEYGATLDILSKAQKSGANAEAVAARRKLEIMAPEFGPVVVKAFQKAEITDARTAEAFFANTEEAMTILKGSAGRKRVILPTMGPLRQARINFVTQADKVINLDRVAPSVVNDMFGGPSTTDGIVKSISEDGALIGKAIKESQSQKGFARLSTQAVAVRLDKFKAKFNIAPMFKNDEFDVTAADASTQIYRLARLVMLKNDAKMVSEAFESIDDIGKRKEMVNGIWNTIAEVRGLPLTESGQKIINIRMGKGPQMYSVGDDFSDIGAIPSDYSPTMTMPSIVDIDRAAARSGLIGRMMNQANKEWVDKMTGYWSFLTLAGPRYALRNAGEDLMVHLAIGGSPWGLAKSKFLSTRVNTALEAARTNKTWNDNPLGTFMRILNKKEAAKYEAELASIDDAIRELKDLKAEINATPALADSPEIAARLSALKAKTKGGAPEQARRIMATALTSGRINRARAALGMKPMFEEEAAILAEHFLYGNIDNTVSLVSEGGFNFATGGDYLTSATLFTRTHGVRSEKLIVNEPKAKQYARQKGKAGFGKRALSSQDEASMLTWLMRMTYYSNDELGSIAVANLDKKNIAIAKITDWMAKNPSFRKEAQLEARGISDQAHAELIYNRAKEIFAKSSDGEVNLELLNKIRTLDDNGNWIVSGKLSLDDLPTASGDIPETVLGPLLVPISDSGNMTASTISKGWTWLGMANARFSREPIVFEHIIKMRKEMKSSGLEDAYIKSVTGKLIDPTPAKLEAAVEKAKRNLAQLVEERAVMQTLQYVDNPLVRTQIAFGVRNWSRFYRATEDMYRRFYRAVRYNPMSIRKAALTFDGIDHNGWIEQDDQGEKYFVYPGLEPVYRAVQTAMAGLGITPEFKTPMPIEFGAQVKMLTPSLNQDSILPTFNGPLAGVSIKTLANLLDVFGAPGAADKITGIGLGKYAVGQSYVSSFLPAHINRLYETMSTDERDSQYASAWRKAVTYLEASGHGLPKKYDADGNLIPPSVGEQEQYRQRIKNTTLSILGTRFIAGFILPASPQAQLKDDMAAWIRDNGKVNFKQAWNGLLDQYPGDYDAAMAKWVELFPNEIPFTVTESERKTVAVIRYAEESGTWVENNKGLFDKYPQGAAFLIPHKSGFSWDAYTTMKNMGLKYNKRVDDYLKDVQTAADLQQYYAKKNEYEASLELMPTDFERSMARKEFENWATIFKAGRPLVQEELAQGGTKQIERMNAINDLRNLLNDPKVKVQGKLQGVLKQMLDAYDEYQLQKEALGNISGASNLVSFMKDDTIVRIRELSNYNENTKSAYNTLFSSLLGDTNG